MTDDIWTVLGTDIVSLIFDLLSSDKKNFRQLSLVSHSTRLIAQHYLYREEFYSTPSKQRSPNIPAHHYEQDIVVAYAQKLRLPFADGWIADLRQGSVNATIALLLCHLDQLTCLHIESNLSASVHWIGSLFGLATLQQIQWSSSPSFLQSLRKAKLDLSSRRYTDTSSKQSQDLLSTLCLPCLDDLVLTFDTPPTLESPLKGFSISSSLTTLSVAELCESLLGELLKSTPRLGTFKWEFYHRCYDTVNLTELSTALVQVSDTLTGLTLKAGMESGDWQEKPPITLKGSLRALKQFEKLHGMQAPLEYLTASFDPDSGLPFSDVLPINLESLNITDDFEGSWMVPNWMDLETYLYIAQWIRDSSRCQSRIREVMLTFKQTYDQWLPDAREAFVELCESYKIRAKVQKAGRDLPSEWIFSRSWKSTRDPELYSRQVAELRARQQVSANT